MYSCKNCGLPLIRWRHPNGRSRWLHYLPFNQIPYCGNPQSKVRYNKIHWAKRDMRSSFGILRGYKSDKPALLITNEEYQKLNNDRKEKYVRWDYERNVPIP